ncbi:MAG TPA: tetratricopeptide repeat protein [Pyrinomonadaceae bacterium]|jgi:tetratricopeptide (TPR) repeat protein
MKLLVVTIAAFVCLTAAPAQAKDAWVGVRSPHYLFVGNASEAEVREVAARFELFRAAFAELFPAFGLNSALPTRVLVFKDLDAYKPFRPLRRERPVDFTSYFQSGLDVNYIALPAGLPAADAYAVPFHESVHLLLADGARRVPDWLNEGLAQYYSTLSLSERGDAVLLGRPVARHVAFLRGRKLLPLAELFAIDRASEEYAAGEASDIFYAQSWALTHYLISGNNGRRQLQLLRFLEMLAAGLPVESSFKQSFHADYATLGAELSEYVAREAYSVKRVTRDARERAESDLRSAPLTEAAAQYYLGDLLLHVERYEDAAGYLKRATALDPAYAPAHAALGLTHVRQRRFAEAKESLRRALALAPDSYLAHYYYAYAVSREGMDEEQAVNDYAPAAAELMRAELRQAITLEPRFAESYRLLAFVNLVRGEQLDEAVALLKRAQALAPGRPDIALTLAQVYLRRQDAAAGRATLESLLRDNTNPRIRARAQALLKTLPATGH